MTEQKKSAADLFGLPKVKTAGKGIPNPIVLTYPVIAGLDADKSTKVWRGKIGKKLLKESVQSQLIPHGCINLDIAYQASSDPEIMQLKQNNPAIKTPYSGKKLYIGQICLSKGKISYQGRHDNGFYQSYIKLNGYEHELCYPHELVQQLADIERYPAEDREEGDIMAAVVKYFEPMVKGDKEFFTTDCKIAYAEGIKPKIDETVQQFADQADLKAISQDDIVQCFIADDLKTSPYKDKQGVDVPGHNLVVCDIWFFRP